MQGVPTELHVYPGAYHAFQYVPGSARTKAFHLELSSILRKAWKLPQQTHS